jgi:putative copper export protein
MVAKIGDDPLGIVAPLSRQLGTGRYTVSWQTAAADGHPSRGSFTFSVVVAAPDTSRAQNRPTQPPVTATEQPNEIISTPVSLQPLNTAEHWALLVAVLTVVGAVVFRIGVLSRASWPAAIAADANDRARRLAQGALALAALAALTRLAAEASLMPSTSVGMRTMWEVARDTRWGHGWLVGAAGIVVAALGFIAWRSSAGILLAALGSIALALSQSLTGHAGADSNSLALSVGGDVIHLLAAGAWIGGLVSVALSGLPALSRQEESNRPAQGSSLVRAYHDVALPSVVLVGLTGLANAWLRVGTLSALVGSAYGRVLIVKLLLFVILASFGYYHWRTAVAPRWSSESASRFRRTAYLELVVGALVLIATALLVSMATPDVASHAH